MLADHENVDSPTLGLDGWRHSRILLFAVEGYLRIKLPEIGLKCRAGRARESQGRAGDAESERGSQTLQRAEHVWFPWEDSYTCSLHFGAVFGIPAIEGWAGNLIGSKRQQEKRLSLSFSSSLSGSPPCHPPFPRSTLPFLILIVLRSLPSLARPLSSVMLAL